MRYFKLNRNSKERETKTETNTEREILNFMNTTRIGME